MIPKYKAPTVKKAFEILRLISSADEGMKISELSRALTLSKSTVHGITAALEDLGALVRDPATKRYILGLTLFELGRSAYARIDLKDIARPLLEDLMSVTGESVFLGVRNGYRVTILDIVESMHDLKITSPVGTSLPLLAGAVGKVILADMEVEQADGLIHHRGLPRYTDRTITDPHQYREELHNVRRLGFATDDEEYISGVRAVASLIQGNGHLTAAVWVVGFKPSLDGDKMARLGADVRSAADAIRKRLALPAAGQGNGNS